MPHSSTGRVPGLSTNGPASRYPTQALGDSLSSGLSKSYSSGCTLYSQDSQQLPTSQQPAGLAIRALPSDKLWAPLATQNKSSHGGPSTQELASVTSFLQPAQYLLAGHAAFSSERPAQQIGPLQHATQPSHHQNGGSWAAAVQQQPAASSFKQASGWKPAACSSGFTLQPFQHSGLPQGHLRRSGQIAPDQAAHNFSSGIQTAISNSLQDSDACLPDTHQGLRLSKHDQVVDCPAPQRRQRYAFTSWEDRAIRKPSNQAQPGQGAHNDTSLRTAAEQAQPYVHAQPGHLGPLHDNLVEYFKPDELLVRQPCQQPSSILRGNDSHRKLTLRSGPIIRVPPPGHQAAAPKPTIPMREVAPTEQVMSRGTARSGRPSQPDSSPAPSFPSSLLDLPTVERVRCPRANMRRCAPLEHPMATKKMAT